jgi:hypothetical protein
MTKKILNETSSSYTELLVKHSRGDKEKKAAEAAAEERSIVGGLKGG